MHTAAANRLSVFLLMLLLALSSAPLRADVGLTTVAERSGFTRTGRYDEVIALCAAFAQRYPDAVRCIDFGATPEGRPMKALVASRSGALTPADARAKGLPVLLVQGGIHAGEIDGKDAGFLALRESLDGETAKGVLDRLVLVFVPVFNVDGHERFGPNNRPNQRGPEEMGWRTTAQNYNLNRDYLKADTPEMQAMLALENAWDPIATIDLHVTDGAKFRHDVSYQIEPLHAGDPQLRKAGLALRTVVVDAVAKQGALPLTFYPSFVENDNPASGFVDGVAPPRFSHGYFWLRNRFGMLVETHSWKPYAHRVKTTHDTIIALLDQTALHGRRWLQLAHAADAHAGKLGGTQVPLDFKATDKARTVDFLGYAYTRTPSEVSGALMTHYDENAPQLWRLPLRDHVVPDHTVIAPRGGYLVPAAYAGWMGAKLEQHGLAFRKLPATLPQAKLQTFRADKATFSSQSFEGHLPLTVEGGWKPETRDLAAGALFVPIAQPKARLVMALLEPQAPDSLLAWGEFNNAFERKEYMEAYVAEDVARGMLAKDPALKARFEQRLRDDPAFAGDPQARLDFFYRRHPSWDERYELYPVYRVDSVPDAR